MDLTPAHQEFLIKKLNEVWPEPRLCPLCRGTAWDIGDQILEIRKYWPGAFQTEGGSIIPLITVICATCSHTILFSAIGLGLIDPESGTLTDVGG